MTTGILTSASTPGGLPDDLLLEGFQPEIRQRRQKLTGSKDKFFNLAAGTRTASNTALDGLFVAKTNKERLVERRQRGEHIDPGLLAEADVEIAHARKAQEETDAVATRIVGRLAAANDIIKNVDRLLAGRKREPEHVGAGLLAAMDERIFGGHAKKVAPAVKLYRPKVTLPASGVWFHGAAEAGAKRIETLRERDAVGKRPTGTAEADKRRIRMMVADLALRGEPSVLGAAEDTRLRIGWPVQEIDAAPKSNTSATLLGRPTAIDASALIAWAFKDKLIKTLERDIDEAYADADTIDPAEKAKLMKELAAKALEYERLEAEYIWAGLDAGEDIFFRADTDPRAILGIA